MNSKPEKFPKHISRNVFALLEAADPIMHADDKNTKIYVEYFNDKRGVRQLGELEKMVEKLKGKSGGRRRRRKSRRKSKKRRKKTKKRRRKRRR